MLFFVAVCGLLGVSWEASVCLANCGKHFLHFGTEFLYFETEFLCFETEFLYSEIICTEVSIGFKLEPLAIDLVFYL